MIITRQEAIKQGLNKYYTGEPCVHGHYSERHVGSHTCIECKNIQKKKQREIQKVKRIKRFGTSGQTKYFTGEVCSKGHIAERFISNGHCVECKKEQGEIYRRRKGIESIKYKKRKTVEQREAKSKKYKESLLTNEERDIVKYARDCLSQLSRSGRMKLSVPQEVAIKENGYSSSDLNKWLSSQKKSYGKRKWHIDHIIPLAKLVKAGVTEVWILNSLDNLQLLSPKKNLQKSSKLLISEKNLQEYIAVKRFNKSPLGMYNPRQRRRQLVRIEANNIYKKLLLNLKNTKFNIKESRAVVIDAIIEDMYTGDSWFYSNGDGATGLDWLDDISKFFNPTSLGRVKSIVKNGYKPLTILHNKNFPRFKYIDECQEFYEKLILQESDKICIEFYRSKIFDCRYLKSKGIFKKFFR